MERRLVLCCWRLAYAIVLLWTTAALSFPLSCQFSRPQATRKDAAASALGMVRNVDLPEAVVLYGDELFSDAEGGVWKNLIEECKDVDAAVLAIASSNVRSALPDGVAYHVDTSSAPSPEDLWNCIHSIQIQPKPFGGSSGFGSVQSLEPERSPLPARCVVFGTTLEHSQAARMAGMRVISINDNPLADAVIDLADIADLWLDDIATPGSYWLNPPHPRDDKGDKVDAEEVIRYYQRQQSGRGGRKKGKNAGSAKTPKATPKVEVEVNDGEMDDDELRRILADIDSL